MKSRFSTLCGKMLITSGVALITSGIMVGCGANGAAEDDAATKRPNILFIFTDDHSPRAISAYGSEINQTPNIDRLAAEGMLFEHTLVTNSICAPSRATILTGKYNHLNGQITNGERFDGTQQTFPKLLQEAGYETAMIGKWHLKSEPTGFDHWQVLIGQGPYYNPPIGTPDDTTIVEGYTTDILTDLALEWLQNGRDPEKPFLMMYQHKAPHRNWQPGPDHLTMYDDVVIPEPETLRDNYEGRTSAARNANMTVFRNLTANDLKITPPRNLTDEQLATWNAAYEPKNEALRRANLNGQELDAWKYQRYIKDYLRAVASVDDNIGRVLDYLEESGLAENTVVVYSSDQGWYLGEHGWYDKRWMYEESLHMPFIVRWPGHITPGSRNQELVSNVDFAPTFLDIAGADIPEDMQGYSLVDQMTSANPEPVRENFYYHYYEYPGSHCVQRHYGVRTTRYKLIYFYEIGEWEFFDLEEDPNEMTSLYESPEHAEQIEKLKTELASLRAQLRVPDDIRPMADCNSDAGGWPGFEKE